MQSLQDTKKIEVVFADSNDDGIVDAPDLFSVFVKPPSITQKTSSYLKDKYIIGSRQ